MDKQPVQRIKRLQYQGVQVYMVADSYLQASDWMDKWLAENDNDFRNIGQVEFDAADDLYIKKVEPVLQSDEPLICGLDEDGLDFCRKGFDTDENAYVFSLVNVQYSAWQFPAQTREEAVRMLQNEEFRDSALLEEGSCFRVISCDGSERAVVDGVIVQVHEPEHVAEELRRRFPSGLVVTLESECVQNLVEYSALEADMERITLYGMVNAGDARMAGANGLLEARLVLSPDDYDLLDACNRTYWDSALADLGWDAGTNAASMMLATEDTFEKARVEADVSPALLECLQIQGRPVRQIMEIVQEEGIRDDESLLHVLDSEFLAVLPDWKLKLAEEQTREATQKYFVEKAAPAFFQQQKMYRETREQAARENGFDSAADWERDLQWTRNPSPQMAARLQAATERWRELYLPHEKKGTEAFGQFERFKVSQLKGFVDRFNSEVSRRMSDVRVVRRAGGGAAVKCSLDGQPQLGVDLKAEDARRLDSGSGITVIARDLAEKYFSKDIVEGLQQQRQHGLKR